MRCIGAALTDDDHGTIGELASGNDRAGTIRGSDVSPRGACGEKSEEDRQRKVGRNRLAPGIACHPTPTQNCS